MDAFVHQNAHCEAKEVGAGTRVLEFAHVGPDVSVGADCVLGEHAMVVGAVVLEDDVQVAEGAYLAGPMRVERGVRIGPVVAVGVGAPRGVEGAVQGRSNMIHQDASIGANATVLQGLDVGRGAIVDPGSVVTQNVPANAVVSGNPARIVAYVDAGLEGSGEVVETASAPPGSRETRVTGVTLQRLTHARDLRGSLTAAEYSELPFRPQRIFTVYDVPNESVRGAHAHRVCSQFLVCLSGSLSCLVDDGSAREEIRLEKPDVGLHIPPMIWATQWRYTRDAVLLVMASHPYVSDDYIRDYEEFLDERNRP